MARQTTVALRSGDRLHIRAVTTDDGPLLRATFDGLGPESRRRRFLVPKARLSDTELRYLTDVDHHRHEALLALDPDSGAPVGVARFVRLPEEPASAEAAIAVVDDWQQRGVGTALLARLADRAREEGIEAFCAEVLPDNRPKMEHLFGHVGRLSERDGVQTIRLHFQLPPRGAGEHLMDALRAAASGALALVRPHLPGVPARLRP